MPPRKTSCSAKKPLGGQWAESRRDRGRNATAVVLKEGYQDEERGVREIKTAWRVVRAVRGVVNDWGNQTWQAARAKDHVACSGAAIDHTLASGRCDADPHSAKTDAANAIRGRKWRREQAVLSPDISRQRRQPALCLGTVENRHRTLRKWLYNNIKKALAICRGAGTLWPGLVNFSLGHSNYCIVI